jgi:hypothetical protein
LVSPPPLPLRLLFLHPLSAIYRAFHLLFIHIRSLDIVLREHYFVPACNPRLCILISFLRPLFYSCNERNNLPSLLLHFLNGRQMKTFPPEAVYSGDICWE